MKKISLYIMALLTMVFAACSEDYTATSSPQSNPQESAVKPNEISFTPVNIAAIDLSKLAKEGIIVDDTPIPLGSVTVAEGALPANTIMKAKVEFSMNADYKDSVVIDCESMAATNTISVLPSNLQTAYYNNFTHNPNEAPVYIRISLFTLTNGTSEAMIGNPEQPTDFYHGNYPIAFTPVNEKGIYISTGYYVVVKQLDNSWIEKKFQHTNTDVYDDPIFTGSIDALKNAEGDRVDTEYYIVAEEDLATFKGGDKSVAFGQGEGEGIVKGGPAFVGSAIDGAAKYKFTLNMEKQAIVVEREYIVFYYNIKGTANMPLGEGETSQNYMFYKTGKNEYNYTTKWPHEYSLKVRDKESKEWGVASGHQLDEQGTLTNKSAKNFGHVGWYTLTITMDENKNKRSYTWTAIETPTTDYASISIIGADGTNETLIQCYSAPHNWYMMGLKLSANTELKFRANTGKEWGCKNSSQSITPADYSLETGTENIKVPAGTYNCYLNDITGNWSIFLAE